MLDKNKMKKTESEFERLLNARLSGGQKGSKGSGVGGIGKPETLEQAKAAVRRQMEAQSPKGKLPNSKGPRRMAKSPATLSNAKQDISKKLKAGYNKGGSARKALYTGKGPCK